MAAALRARAAAEALERFEFCRLARRRRLARRPAAAAPRGAGGRGGAAATTTRWRKRAPASRTRSRL
eukprot:6777584-Prymnesium_polylepis.1